MGGEPGVFNEEKKSDASIDVFSWVLPHVGPVYLFWENLLPQQSQNAGDISRSRSGTPRVTFQNPGLF